MSQFERTTRTKRRTTRTFHIFKKCIHILKTNFYKYYSYQHSAICYRVAI